MARGRALRSIEDYRRALKNGYGLGAGVDYRPWIRVIDGRSHGKSVKIPGIKTARVHQLLSGIEESFFYFIEYQKIVADIREQFPLFPIDMVKRVADEAGLE